MAGVASPNGLGGRRSGPDLEHRFGHRSDATGEPTSCAGSIAGTAPRLALAEPYRRWIAISGGLVGLTEARRREYAGLGR